MESNTERFSKLVGMNYLPTIGLTDIPVIQSPFSTKIFLIPKIYAYCILDYQYILLIYLLIIIPETYFFSLWIVVLLLLGFFCFFKDEHILLLSLPTRNFWVIHLTSAWNVFFLPYSSVEDLVRYGILIDSHFLLTFENKTALSSGNYCCWYGVCCQSNYPSFE